MMRFQSLTTQTDGSTVVHALCKASKGDGLVMAVLEGDHEGLLVDVQDQKGQTALHVAAAGASNMTVSTLLKNFSVNAMDKVAPNFFIKPFKIDIFSLF